jgi:hypothetical protein
VLSQEIVVVQTDQHTTQQLAPISCHLNSVLNSTYRQPRLDTIDKGKSQIPTYNTTTTAATLKMGGRDKDLLPTMASTPPPTQKMNKKMLAMQSDKERHVYTPPSTEAPDEMGKKESFSSGLSLPVFPKWPWPGRPGHTSDVLPTFVSRRTSTLGNMTGFAANSPYAAKNEHWDLGHKEKFLTGQEFHASMSSEDKANDLGRVIMKTIPVVALLLLAGLAIGGLVLRLFL